MFAFVAYIDMFFLPIRDLSARYTLLQSAMTGAERVFELMDNTDEDAPRIEGLAESAKTPATRKSMAKRSAGDASDDVAHGLGG